MALVGNNKYQIPHDNTSPVSHINPALHPDVGPPRAPDFSLKYEIVILAFICDQPCIGSCNNWVPWVRFLSFHR